MNDRPDAVLLDIAEGVATVTLNRPERRNAIDDATRLTLIDTLEHINADESVRAVVLTGAGSAFCAGGDIKGMKERMEAPVGRVGFNGWKRQKSTHRLIMTVHTLDKPTIAAVNGASSGLGSDLAFACDFVMVSEAATFAMAYRKRGLIPDGGGLYFLPRRVGLPRAKELIYSARTVGADEALAIGLADRRADGDVVTAARAWAGELAEGSMIALALAKSILNRGPDLPVEQVLALSSEAQAVCYATDDHRDSVRAFLDKSARR
ncbi:enoyl-CoA hydratase/isomerase family protein [Acuticoccus mangrovi]|uniref:Enoyl-CoA hydratase/isomerase family protein n=1 Tax=Acuticoccus mangrovi TaxID=2796142 RepID=A0A934MEN7_9HYPH|nr:enoyl-CoA hydratase/isomerase family protein [Acuticoccus mangrovi]MBJ3774568.1 enoyl-CoA hydratase/isomerase family protein [Acuticoccus mangrovi]